MLSLYSTLSHKIEPFQSLEPRVVKMYSCGPTVYRYAHIGNLRTYLMADWLRRTLAHQGYEVTHIKNITDVGHMRQEMLERGEDKIIAAALAEGKSPQAIAQFYTGAFHRDEAKLNILPASRYPHATEHIIEMLEIIERLVKRGYAYENGGNVYFEVKQFPGYGKLSGNIGSALLTGVRVESDPLKKDPRDFLLWKAAEPGRTMKWPSPWGDGFPGWHIECSAMSTKYLGQQLDIHTGGVDNTFPHHEGEIAQSEAAFGRPFCRFWVHGQHLLAEGVKMAKSSGNSFTLEELEGRGFEATAFRYLCLTVHYRARLNFTFTALKAAQTALLRLKNRVWQWSSTAPLERADKTQESKWREGFWKAVNNDLNMPGAMALAWEMVGADLPDSSKLHLLLEFDQVFGLGLERVGKEFAIPKQIALSVNRRDELRGGKAYQEGDKIRAKLQEKGYTVHDLQRGSIARQKTPWERHQEPWRSVSSSQEVPSLLSLEGRVDFTVALVACNYLNSVRRCLESALKYGAERDIEVIAVDNGSTDSTAQWLEEVASREHRVRVIHTDHTLGDAAARNIALKQSLGKYIVFLDPSIEVTGDIFGPLRECLNKTGTCLVGPWGLISHDLKSFVEASGEVDAMQAYCMAFHRDSLHQVGLMREGFRFYRNLDLDFSFQFKDKGCHIMALPELPIRRHEHLVWSNLSPEVRDTLSNLNFRRFYRKWHSRRELLVASAQS